MLRIRRRANTFPISQMRKLKPMKVSRPASCQADFSSRTSTATSYPVSTSQLLIPKTSSSHRPHFSEWHLHYSTCSGQKPCCSPWLLSFLLSTSSHPSGSPTSPTWPTSRIQPLLITSTAHRIWPRLLLEPSDISLLSTLVTPPHTYILYSLHNWVFCFKNMSDHTLCGKPCGGFPSHSELFIAADPGREQHLPSRRCSSEYCWLVNKRKMAKFTEPGWHKSSSALGNHETTFTTANNPHGKKFLNITLNNGTLSHIINTRLNF